MNSKLTRLDKLLVDKNFVESRSLAQEYIEQGRVSIDGRKVTKSASQVSKDSHIVLDAPERQWVSRGAHKLLKALDSFDIDPTGMFCIDIGASTGGFTDVLLVRGAESVCAVDVGYGQLAWKLRKDPRVIVLERTNARYLKSDMLRNKKADIIVSDASFISLKLLLGPLETLLEKDGVMIVLLKPQFEVGKGRIGKGVVSDPKLHEDVIDDLAAFISNETGLKLLDATFSPIRGPEGNIEFLFLLCLKESNIREAAPIDTELLVSEAHRKTITDESRLIGHEEK